MLLKNLERNKTLKKYWSLTKYSAYEKPNDWVLLNSWWIIQMYDKKDLLFFDNCKVAFISVQINKKC